MTAQGSSSVEPHDLDAALHRYFGFDVFRPGQREVIEAVLAGRSTVAIMPTGGGKSLCYQLPALLSQGVTRGRLPADRADEGSGPISSTLGGSCIPQP